MRQFPDHTEVQEWGLKLCEVLAGNHDCRVLLAEFEVHVVAVEAMARFLDNPAVHAAGSLTLLAMVAHEGARGTLQLQTLWWSSIKLGVRHLSAQCSNTGTTSKFKYPQPMHS